MLVTKCWLMAKGQSGHKKVKGGAFSFNLKGQSRAIPVDGQFSGDADITYRKNHSSICTFKKQKRELRNVIQAKFINAKLILAPLQEKTFIVPIQVMNIFISFCLQKIQEIDMPITPQVSNSLTMTTS